MEYEEKGDGQHGAAAAPKHTFDEHIVRERLMDARVAGAIREGGSLCYTKEEVAWRDKMSRLDELLRKAGITSEAIFIECVRAVFGTKEG